MSDFQAAKYKAKIIRIYHECEGGIEKNRPKDHWLASRGLPSDDKRWSQGTDFLSHPKTNNEVFFLLTT